MPCRARPPWPAGPCPKVIHTLIPAGCAQAGSRPLCKKHPEHRQSPQRAGPGDPSRAYPQAGPPQSWTSRGKIAPPRPVQKSTTSPQTPCLLTCSNVHAACPQPGPPRLWTILRLSTGPYHPFVTVVPKHRLTNCTKNRQTPADRATHGLQQWLQRLSTTPYSPTVHNLRSPVRKSYDPLQAARH